MVPFVVFHGGYQPQQNSDKRPVLHLFLLSFAGFFASYQSFLEVLLTFSGHCSLSGQLIMPILIFCTIRD
jgi:hypothetical protein